MRIMMAVVLLVGGVVACASRVKPTEETPTPQNRGAVPASLLRRVAEAADGFRDGKDKYVVADFKFPHKVNGVFQSRQAADSARRRAIDSTGATYDVYGPFRTIDDPPAIDTDPVDSVIVVRRSGKREPYDGAKYDAIFWSLPAFDKFVAPYLTSVSSVKYAADQRELYRAGKSPLVHSSEVGHWRGSF